MNPNEPHQTGAFPPEVDDLIRDGSIPPEDIDSLLWFRDELIAASPQPRAQFRDELAQKLSANFPANSRLRRYPTSKYVPLRLALIAVFLLMVGIGAVLAVNTILREFIGHDAGLNSIFEGGGGLELNQSATVGNYTVNVLWANADHHRLTIGFTVAGFGCANQYVSCNVFVRVFDSDGVEIPRLDGRADNRQDTIRSYLYNFDLSKRSADTAIAIYQLQITPYGTINAGPIPDQPGMIYTRSVQLNAPIIMDIVLPLNGQTRSLKEVQYASDAEITLALRRALITPSQTRIAICYPSPSPEPSWTAIPYLTAGESEVVGGGAVQSIVGIGEAVGEICNEFIYNAAMFDYTGEWRLEIRELVGFSQSTSRQLRVAGSWIFDFVVP